jgi:NAD(P)H-flavin reductase
MQKDIIFKDELELMQHRNDHLKVVHTLTRPIDEWKGCRGRIFKDITQEKNELVKYTQVESFSTHSKKPYTS